MKQAFVFILGFFISFSVSAQKQVDDANAEIRNVSGFHAIKVSHGITVYLTQSNTEAVAVSANEVEYRNRIKTVVENGVLKIYFDNEDWKIWKNLGNKKLRAYVSVKDLDRIGISSGASIKVEGVVKTSSLSIDASSGATLNGAIEAGDMNIDMSSGSVVTVSGTVSGILKVDGSSGSTFRGYDLKVENCDADVSSGAGMQITVIKELSADASSGGYIHYKGSGLIRDIHTSSGGSVSRKS